MLLGKRPDLPLTTPFVFQTMRGPMISGALKSCATILMSLPIGEASLVRSIIIVIVAFLD